LYPKGRPLAVSVPWVVTEKELFETTPPGPADCDVVVVSQQWIQELLAAADRRRFFSARDGAALDRLARKLCARGRLRFLWLEYPSAQRPTSGEVRMPSGLVIDRTHLGRHGDSEAFRCEVRESGM
jgi:hypothetical protein